MADPTSCGSEVLFRRFLKIFICGIMVKQHDNKTIDDASVNTDDMSANCSQSA